MSKPKWLVASFPSVLRVFYKLPKCTYQFIFKIS